MKILIKPLYDDVTSPLYATEFSAGFDLVAHNFKKIYDPTHPFSYQEQLQDQLLEGIIEAKEVTLVPHGRVLIGCGFALKIPNGYMMDVRPRSGNALSKGLTVLNSPGTIDSDYTGEIGVILYNSSNNMVSVKLGERIAQGIIMSYEAASFQMVEELPTTKRGEGGYGHTG